MIPDELLGLLGEEERREVEEWADVAALHNPGLFIAHGTMGDKTQAIAKAAGSLLTILASVLGRFNETREGRKRAAHEAEDNRKRAERAEANFEKEIRLRVALNDDGIKVAKVLGITNAIVRKGMVLERAEELVKRLERAEELIDRLACDMDDCPCPDPEICSVAREFLKREDNA